MEALLTPQQQKIHPHKMLMWIGIGSIIMMFAGWTSAFIVRKAQGNWMLINLPTAFWISTAVIIMSSITMVWSIYAFKKRSMLLYQFLTAVTAVLGVVFLLLQIDGFKYMMQHGILLDSKGDSVSGSYIYVISGIHMLHMLGGVIALIGVFLRANFSKKTRTYSSTGLEIVGIYWHFVDILWVYLFLFFLYNQH